MPGWLGVSSMDTSKRLPPDRERCFPQLFASGYSVTSDEDFLYNCIAWAAGSEKTQEWWDPFAIGRGYYWPAQLPRSADIQTFIKLYEIAGGYSPSDTGALEPGFEKVALYADRRGEVTHAARQTEEGSWTSKLGEWEDIEHKTLEGLCGDDPAYGTVAQILKRPRKAL